MKRLCVFLFLIVALVSGVSAKIFNPNEFHVGIGWTLELYHPLKIAQRLTFAVEFALRPISHHLSIVVPFSIWYNTDFTFGLGVRLYHNDNVFSKNYNGYFGFATGGTIFLNRYYSDISIGMKFNAKPAFMEIEIGARGEYDGIGYWLGLGMIANCRAGVMF
ncbi:MAG: hypothetical protein HPY53_01615 [Brevinematales bacterium]|nr:hypothetical protein [Brevinematales bacterium]